MAGAVSMLQAGGVTRALSVLAIRSFCPNYSGLNVKLVVLSINCASSGIHTCKLNTTMYNTYKIIAGENNPGISLQSRLVWQGGVVEFGDHSKECFAVMCWNESEAEHLHILLRVWRSVQQCL